MKNINISLTVDQARLVDKKSADFGFANRSEFFRAMLRYIFLHSPDVLTRLDAAAFEQPVIKNIKQIEGELKKSGKYNKAFIQSVSKGLKKSDYFNQK